MMNDDQTQSFAEQAVTWLYDAEFVVYVVTGVALLVYQYPAYKRFRTRALLLLVISCATGLFIAVFDQTIGQKGPPDPNDWWNYYLVRELTWLVTVILGTIGALMFLGDYIRLATASNRSPSLSPPRNGAAPGSPDRPPMPS